MNKILGYEIKRLIFNKIALGLLGVLLGYGYLTLTKVTILGVNYHAPFSLISFGDYMLHLLPILVVILFLFIWRENNYEVKKLAAILDSTPTDGEKLKKIRALAIIISEAIFALMAVCLNLGFMAFVFLL